MLRARNEHNTACEVKKKKEYDRLINGDEEE